MELGEPFQTYSPTQALKREKNGTFLVTTPLGEEIYITCKPGPNGETVTNIEWPPTQTRKPFLVVKIAEPVNIVPGVTGHRLHEATG
jgi:hypothetical protein